MKNSSSNIIMEDLTVNELMCLDGGHKSAEVAILTLGAAAMVGIVAPVSVIVGGSALIGSALVTYATGVVVGGIGCWRATWDD